MYYVNTCEYKYKIRGKCAWVFFFKITQLLKAIHKKEIIGRSIQRYINNAQSFPKGLKLVCVFKPVNYLEYAYKLKHCFSIDQSILFVVQWFSTSLDIIGLTELSWFVWSLFVWSFILLRILLLQGKFCWNL